MISVEKPGSPAEILEHHGTKGMKWGVRRANRMEANSSFKTANPTAHDRQKAIRVARAKSQLDLTNYGTEKFGKTRGQRKELKKVYLRNPDRATAMRFTRGEKIVTAIIAAGVPPAAPAIGVGVTANVLYRHHVQNKQARGGYN